MASPKQLWARERNWNKARLTNCLYALQSIARQDSTVGYERAWLKSASLTLDHIIQKYKMHEEQSRDQFIERNKNA